MSEDRRKEDYARRLARIGSLAEVLYESGIRDKAMALLAAAVIDLLVDLILAPVPTDPIIAPPIVFIVTWLVTRKKIKRSKLLSVIAAILSAFPIP
ncbi:MAG: hypothetical protein DRN99_05775 [Thermoproteota archaeon]|nr:MAG: hypothetical protein DRN99_05775 [Candidatus Korarchaeota archaeon]